MDEVKELYFEEVSKRKELAKSAGHRRGYTRYNKSFAQPSEHYTALRKKNGEMKTYRIGQPISWEEFVSYPHEMQQKWVDAFGEKFDCCAGGMTIAFDKTVGIVNSYMYRKKIKHSGGRLTAQKVDAIRAWMEASVAPVEASVAPVEASVAPRTLRSGTLCLEGKTGEVCQTLFSIFRDARIDVRVEFTVLPEEPEEPEETEEPVDPRLDVNSCALEDLLGVGITKDVANILVQERPFSSMEEIAKLDGIRPIAYAFLEKKVRVG